MLLNNGQTLISFQFQNGSIKRSLELEQSYYLTYFNSKMVRLKVFTVNVSVVIKQNFNSKMVRLKV